MATRKHKAWTNGSIWEAQEELVRIGIRLEKLRRKNDRAGMLELTKRASAAIAKLANMPAV